MSSKHLSTHYDMADFHEQQLEHYRKKAKTNPPPRTDKPLPPLPPKTTEDVLEESHGFAHQMSRREGKRPSRQSDGLEMATKHLGKLEINTQTRGRTPERQYSPGPNSPVDRPRTYSPAPPSPMGRPQSPDRVRRIVRNKDGKFEEQNVVEDRVHRHPTLARPVTPPSRRGSYSSSRPGSSSSMRSIFSWGKSPGKYDSPPPSPSSFRPSSRGSFREQLSRGKDIVSLNSHDRRRFLAEEKARIKQDSKNKRSRAEKDAAQAADWEATIARSRALRAEVRARIAAFDTEPEPEPRPTPIDRAALAVSKLTDWAKKRKGSEDSVLSFADCAPAWELEGCARCGRQVEGKGALTKGLCGGCWGRRVDEFWESNSHLPDEEENSTYSSNSSTRSSSPTLPREVNEEEYMKIARLRRIRRIRQTIYSDPGNPFAFDEEDDTHTTLLQGPRDHSPAPMEEPSRLEPTSSPSSILEEFQCILDDSPTSPPPDRKFSHVRDSLLYAPTPRRSGTPALIKQLSIPVSPAPPTPPVKDERFLVAKTIPRKRSLSWGGKESPKLEEGEGDVRNTMYYGFYDQVLQEYRSPERLVQVEGPDYVSST